MKKLLFYIALFMSGSVYAQDSLRRIYLPKDLTIHFISPEPIQYVDISSKALAGDLPLKNVLRIRMKDSAARFTDAVVTIAGEKFIAQYHVLPGTGERLTEISITPADTRPLDISGIGFSQNQLKTMALSVFSEKPETRVEKVKDFGITGKLSHIYSAGDYIFLDISFQNKTRLKYDIDDLRFRIDDKKVTKASNVQSFELKPEFVLFSTTSFSKNYRNIFVFKKISFPGNKVLLAELSEKQVSGRVLTLRISYQDILNADTIPN
jgi:conjugative transposon TraN protein